ncbi:helix-turn-helix transcriptional regulator [Serpentinicella sp. ANB-PHB4]|uniref:helix-turn-helix transcriptional regulator n=1 Tax=Serpentinicella sp. ANB-PHB4 TaxID=3074076 RepID=UPI00285B22C9|nr:helix-turn-helix transcriptional regulator [Serpentinicella sp. ANB-PHB4]MDR5659872.1 helix-turn-helix transcriptional regulator [Serpentinicella sp. ANB-PHB4]
MKLSTSEKIRILCKRKNITLAQLAEKLNISSQNLSNKLSRDNFPEKELKKIAETLGCFYESYFVLDDNEKI